MGVGEARAKLLLFGEHAAVYGHPAVGMALPWALKVTHTPGGPWVFPGLGMHEPAVRGLVQALVALGRDRGLPLPVEGRVEVETEVPLSSGYGSSGALCAALVNAFWPTLPLDDRDLLAWRAEGQFHGTPSGIDTALALRHGWWRLDPSTKPVRATPLPDPGLVLVTGAVTRESDTKTLVGNLARRLQDGDPVVVRSLEDLGTIARRAADALVGGKTDVCPLVQRARATLQTLDLETSDLTRVLDAGLGAGALAGKLSGAGGGGAFYLVFPSETLARGALATIEGAVPAGVWTAPPRVIGATGP